MLVNIFFAKNATEQLELSIEINLNKLSISNVI